jgi:hypothetical protein
MRHLAAILICAGVLGVSCADSSTSPPANSPGPDNTRMQTEEFAVNEIPLTLPLAQPKIVVVKSKRRLMLNSHSNYFWFFLAASATFTFSLARA